jgi:NAD(P)-dependent dehydrogenase (short-subunit alcohol dehydrogenase family)
MFQQASVFRSDLFTDKVVFVTGGAKGIGLAIAAELRILGAHVFIGSRNEDNLRAGCAELQAMAGGGRVEYAVCNIRDQASIGTAVDTCLGSFGRLDFLVNNAGGQFPAPAMAMTPKGWQAVVDTNLTGTFFMTQAAVTRAMAEQGSGVVVNIIAQMHNGFPMMSHTGATRAGVDNLTKSLAFEFAPLGVRVNAVAPGVILSSGVDNYAPDFKQAFLGAKQHIPMGRLGTVREVSAAVAFLLSPAAAFITGATLRVDGGEPLFGSAAAGMMREQLELKPHPQYD